MTTPIKIAILGECMVELRTSNGTLDHGFGGDTLNTATYIARLTHKHGIETQYLTGLGKDPFSRKMLELWQQENIATEHVHIDDEKNPGIYAIETSEDGERSFSYWRNDSAAKFWLRHYSNQQLIDTLSNNHWIYLSGISLAILPEDCLSKLIKVLTACHSNGTAIAFDNNYRPTLWQNRERAQSAYRQILALTNIAFLTFDDEVLLWGDESEQQSINRARDLGVSEIVVKRGAEACFIVSGDDKFEVPANLIENVVDTTAAGDSFSGGYLAKKLIGGTPIESAQAGHLLAGTVIQHSGAVIAKEFMPII
ncbi:ketodeoxygluconokinase [Vibrio sp. qd031]|uniref:sugar kinase n=1 Tax=Vibrio sp. qd031 TaxID=1603038 RepID=UPI000A0F620D|nr:sugar kinase [Vibrio sp. qd031]ORT52267.1 ketodeoxygluconokinase [Vibrio sp. qd031]